MLLIAYFLAGLLCFGTIILIKIMLEYIDNRKQEKEKERQRELKAQKEKEHRDPIQRRDDEIVDLIKGYYKYDIVFNFYSLKRLLINENIEYSIYLDNEIVLQLYIYFSEIKIDMYIYKVESYDKVRIVNIYVIGDGGYEYNNCINNNNTLRLY